MSFEGLPVQSQMYAKKMAPLARPIAVVFRRQEQRLLGIDHPERRRDNVGILSVSEIITR